ncbi:MAG: oligosaccharide flippase family protein [Candidatus Woesearchaeota archaeon]
MEFIKETLKAIKYNIILQSLQLLFLIIIYYLIPNDFKIMFFWLTLIFFYRSLFLINFNENNLEKVKKFYSNANFSIIIISTILCLFLIIISIFIEEYSEILKFTAILLFLSSFSIVPESFLKSRKDYKRLFYSRLISQLGFILGLFLAYKKISEAIFYAYIMYYIIYVYKLYKTLPISIKPKKGKINLTLKLPSIKYLYYIFTFIIFGADFFAFNLILIEISYFVKNVFSFLISYYNNFSTTEDKEELLKLNYIRLHEYIYFFSMPYYAILLTFLNEFLKFLSYEKYTLEAYIILAIGFLNIDFTNMILYAKQKTKAIKNLNLLKLILFIFVILTSIFGLKIFIISFFIYSLLIKLTNILIMKNNLNLDIITKDYFYVFFAASISTLIMLFLKEYLSTTIINLILIILIGKLVYILIVYLLSKEMLKRLIKYIFSEQNQ